MRPPVPPPHPWIGDIMPALGWSVSDGYGDHLPAGASDVARMAAMEKARSTIVIMVDGLGTHNLLGRLAYAPTLRRMSADLVVAQTCAPSTTAAALTAFATGCLPAATNMVGYSVRDGAGVMSLLQFRQGIDVPTWQSVTTFFERFASHGIETALVTDPKFRGSGLTQAAMRGARFAGAGTLGDRFARAVHEVRSGVPLVYVYWASLDKTGHQYGPHSPEWALALENFDAELGRFLSDLGGQAQVVLTADHGMVEATTRIDVAMIPELSDGVSIIAGEGRAAHVHALPGRGKDVEARWRRYWGERAWIVSPADFPDVLGTGPGLDLIGDLMVFPKGQAVVVDSRTQSESAVNLRGVHGSLTREEMEIPFWRLA